MVRACIGDCIGDSNVNTVADDLRSAATVLTWNLQYNLAGNHTGNG